MTQIPGWKRLRSRENKKRPYVWKSTDDDTNARVEVVDNKRSGFTVFLVLADEMYTIMGTRKTKTDAHKLAVKRMREERVLSYL